MTSSHAYSIRIPETTETELRERKRKERKRSRSKHAPKADEEDAKKTPRRRQERLREK
jgi:hypothetical protein